MVTCAMSGCSNSARYIDELGRLVCGTCPVANGLDAIRLADVPRLLSWSRRYIAGPHCFDGSDWELRDIIGRRP